MDPVMVLLVVALGLLVQVRRTVSRERQRAQVRDRLEQVTKELASWDRTKELGFDDVVEWEAAFKLATGQLPEGSRTKELERQRRHQMELESKLMQAAYPVGMPIRVGNYAQGGRMIHGSYKSIYGPY